MQLKELAKVSEASDAIKKVGDSITDLDAIGKTYTTSVLKEAIANSTLEKTQIKRILTANGLQGEILETTADELANAASTNAVAASQKAATGTTLGLGTAFKGLGLSIKALAVAHPILTAIAAVGALVTAIIAIQDAVTDSYEELEEKADSTKQALQNTQSEIKTLNTQLNETKEKIDELNGKDSLSFVEQDELNKLKTTTEELERELAIKKELEKQQAKEAADAAQSSINAKQEYSDHKVTTTSYEGVEIQENAYLSRPEQADWYLGQIESNNSELEALYQKRKEIEEKYNNDASKYTNDKDWKNNEKNISSKTAYIEEVGTKLTSMIGELQEADNKLYDADGNVIKGKEELVSQLEALYDKFFAWLNGKNDKDIFVEKLQDSGISEKASNEIASQLSDEKLEILSTTDQATIDKYIAEETEKLQNAQNEVKENLENEYQKIDDWGLSEYAEQIKNGTIQSVFGNVDMDKRTIIHWSDELKQTYADALASWDYDPKVGSIDTVFGGSDRFGEELNGTGWEVAFTPILPDGTFLSKDTVEEYINSILAEAYADDGKVTTDELTKIDAEGRQIGNVFVHGIFAGIDDSQNYDDNGNWAEVVGRLMHFSGDFGAVKIAQDKVAKSSDNASDSANNMAQAYSNAADRIKEAKDEAANTDTTFSKDFKSINDSLQTLTDNASLLSDVNKQISETGRIAADDLAKINEAFPEDKYPEMTKALYEYQMGLISEQELFAELEKCYEVDKNAYIEKLKQQLNNSEIFYENVLNGNEQLNTMLGKLYGDDFGNWKNLAQLKAGVEKQLIADLGNLWSKYYQNQITSFQIIKDATTGLYSTQTNEDSPINTNANPIKSGGLFGAKVLGDLHKKAQEKEEKDRNAIDFALNQANSIISQFNSSLDTYAPNFSDFSWDTLGSDSSSSSDSATDALQDAFEKEKKALDRLRTMELITDVEYYNRLSEINDKYYKDSAEHAEDYADNQADIYAGLKSAYKSVIEDQMDYLEKALKANKITYSMYSNSVKELLDDMYHSGKLSAKDYFDYTEKMLEQQLDIYSSALSGVTNLLDKEIDKWQDKIDSLNDENDLLGKNLDDMDSALSAIDKVYDDEIDRIQSIIDGLDEANDERQRAINLEKAKYELERAYNQKVIKQFAGEGKGFIYTIDSDAVSDAKQNYEDIKAENAKAELEKQIKTLEDYKQKWQEIKNAHQQYLDEMNANALLGSNYQSTILKNNILDIDNFKNQYVEIQKKINDNTELIESYEQKKEIYSDLKEQWNDISSTYEDSTNRQYASMLLGASWESDILNGRLDKLNDFKNQYTALQQSIADAAWNSANEQIKASQALNLSSNTPSFDSTGSSSDDSSNGSNGTPDWAIYKEYYAQKLNRDTSLVDRLKSNNIDASFESCRRYWNILIGDGEYYGTEEQNIRLLNWLKDNGYATGTINAKKGLNLVGEEGAELYEDNDGNISLVKSPTLIPMNGGEQVINANETRKILKNKEGVELLPLKGYDTAKWEKLVQSINLNTLMPSYAKPNYSYLNNVTNNRNTQQSSINIGDIHLHEVQNVDGLSKAIISKLPGKMIQAASRR